MDTVVFQSAKATEYFSKSMVLVKIDAEKDTAVAREMAISGYPTLVLLDSKGDEIDRVIGYMETDPFLKQLDDYEHGIGTLGDLLNKSKTDTSRTLSYNVAEKYKYRGKMDDARTWYQKVISGGKANDSLAGESRMAVADMIRRDKKWDEAYAAFTGVMNDFKATPFATDAELWRAIILSKKGDTAASITAYEAFIKNNPTSEDTSYARKQIDKLKNPPKEEKK